MVSHLQTVVMYRGSNSASCYVEGEDMLPESLPELFSIHLAAAAVVVMK